MAVDGNWTYLDNGDGTCTITDYDEVTGGSTITIPSVLSSTLTVSTITAWALESKSLTNITIDYPIELDDGCFRYNSGVSVSVTTDSIDFIGSDIDDSAAPFYNCAIGDNVFLDNAKTTIDGYLFKNSGVTSITFPENLETIEVQAFYNNSISSVDLISSLDTIGNFAFSNNNISEITIDHPMTIGSGAFRNNSNLVLSISSNITYSGSQVASTSAPFYNCDLGDNVTISDDVTFIDDYILAYSGLTSIIFHNGIDSIGDLCMQGNNELSLIKIYNADCVIGSNVLADCFPDPKGTIFGYADSTAYTLWTSYSTYYNFWLLADIDTFTVGQLVKIKLNGVLRFTGVVNDCNYYKDNESNQIKQQVSCTNLNNIPARRTIKMNYAAGTTASTIVESMADDYLSQEGIEQGEIDDGSIFEEEWTNDITNIAEVLDECANRSGFQWFIDNDMKLNFYKNPTTVSTCTYTLEDLGAFQDYRNVQINENIDNYSNKFFIVGGNDEHGDIIYTINGDIERQNEIQNSRGGTGVYGLINRDSAIVGHEYKTIGSGSSPTTVVWTGHPLQINDFFWNKTRDVYSFVVSTTSNSFVCETVTSQASGDIIEAYVEANTVGRNMLNRQSEIPQKLTFHSYSTEFYPGEKLNVSIADISASGVFCIDEVNITEKEACYWDVNVSAILRILAEFNTQKNLDYTDYFRGF